MIHPITQNVIDIFTFFRDFVGIHYYITETGNHDYLIDERLASLGFDRLDSFRDRRWLVGDVVWSDFYPVSCILHFPFPLHLLYHPQDALSRSSSTFRVHDCFVTSINYPRLTGEYGRTDGDNNDNDKRINNTPTYSGTRLWTILMLARCNNRDESAWSGIRLWIRDAKCTSRSRIIFRDLLTPNKREFCISSIYLYLKNIEMRASMEHVSS